MNVQAKPLRPSEQEAQLALSALLRCQVLPRDPGGGSSQLHDFDLVFEDGHAEAVEVTEAAIQPLRQAEAAHHSKIGYRFDVPGIKYLWHLYPSMRSRFGAWKAEELGRRLAELEDKSKLKFFYGTDYARDETVRGLVHDYGVEWGRAHVTDATPYVLVSPPSDRRVWSSNHDNPGMNAVETLCAEASKGDNQAKLAKAATAERHLFVWVPHDNYLPWADLERGQLPTLIPQLPNAITTAWLASRNSDNRLVLWRLRPASGWDCIQDDAR